MPNTIFDSKTLAELVGFLLADQNLSYRELAERLGVSQTTVANLKTAAKRPDPDTLDKLASYAGLTREFVYELGYDIHTHPGYTRLAAEVAALIQNAPEDVQQLAAASVQAIIAARKKQP